MQGERLMVTGHRPHRIASDDVRWVRRQLARAITSWDPAILISGLARGTDTWAAEAAIAAGVPLEVFIPCREQSKRWNRHDRSRHAYLVSQADDVHVCSNRPCSASLYHARDRAMVNASTGPVIAVWDGTREGGTFSTMDYAYRHARPVAVIDPAQRSTTWWRG